jgi:flagellar M-ring protein FliF
MPAFFRVIFEQIAAVLKDLSVAQRMTLTLLGVVIFVSLFALTIWGSRPDYQTLYAGLSQQDAGDVVKKLAEKNVPYKLGADGTTILVPAKNVRETRVSLASEGLPKVSSVGFELFDQFKLGTTEFTQKVNYQRAMEAELAKTVMTIKEIRAARVHIVIPEDSLFAEDNKDGASASLVIDLAGSQPLTDGQVNGLVHLIASSVKGLSAKNVSIVDTHGNVLYAYSEEEGMQAGLSMTQVEVQRKYEKMIQSQIESMLTNVFGAKSSVVRVNVAMNFDRLNTDSELYIPSDLPNVRSERAVEEGYKGNNSAPPANLNIPGAQNNAQNSNYTKTDETRNFELSKRVEHFTKSPGAIQKLSIAVILDRKLKDDEKQNLMDAISSASGLDKERGDILTLSTFPFDKTSLEKDTKEMKSMKQNELVLTVLKNIGLLLLLGLTVFYARRQLRRLSAISASGGSWGINQVDGTTREVPRPVLKEEAEVSEEDQKKQAMKNSIIDMAHSDPDVFAKILRRWLAED